MFLNRGIAFRLTVFILACCSAIFAVTFGYNYLVSRRIIVRNIEENARSLTAVTVNKIETVLRAVEKVPQNLAYSLEDSSYRREGLMQLLRTVVENNPEIYGSTIAFEPLAFDGATPALAPYYYKNGGKLKFSDLAADAYRYSEWDWYRIPKEQQKPVWTEPYFDKGGGNVVMSTYSVPFYRNQGGEKRFAGIVTADVYLSWLQDLVSSIRVGETGYGFLISRKGTIVTHPRRELIMHATLSGIAGTRGDERLREIAAAMASGKSGFVPAGSTMTGTECWIAYAPIPSAGWSLGVLFPRGELMADVASLNRTVLLIGLAGVLFLLAVIVSVSSSITKPLRKLSRTTRDIARGNLDFAVPAVPAHDEVGQLADSFVVMRDSLKKYIAELTATTAAKERMESELAIAHDIQMSLLPAGFPRREEFELYAVLQPAREVGGDLYDFFPLDDDRLCIVIGDVSGKGVPAALFMAMTKTLIKAVARSRGQPDEVLRRVNEEIVAGNERCMFVSAWCGILDIAAGEVWYANAGHNPPLAILAGGGVEFLRGAGGAVVGVVEEERYERARLLLRPGDTLVLYTDGVTEAFNGQREQFTEERLAREASALRGERAQELAMGILLAVRSFAGAAPQSDDITVMALQYLGGQRGSRS
jgi:sigma-B regulation protein RsbU (phosphoserine phosphatase)